MSRSELSFFASSQRDSDVSGAKAMSSSRAGSGGVAPRERTKRSLLRGELARVAGGAAAAGFHTVAGTSPSPSASLRGPTRRSTIAAIDCRQFDAACARSFGDIVTCTSFSASAKVAADTCGPVDGEVPNAGGAVASVAAPRSCAAVPPALSAPLAPARRATATPASPSAVPDRNCRRDVLMARDANAEPKGADQLP